MPGLAHAGRRSGCSDSGVRTARRGDHFNYTFENLFLDNWYSLVQMEQEQAGPAQLHVPQYLGARSAAAGGVATFTGNVTGVVLDNVKYGQKVAAANADVPLSINDAQAANSMRQTEPVAEFTVDPPRLERTGSDIYCEGVAARAVHVAVRRRDGGTRAQGEARLSRCGWDRSGRHQRRRGRFRVMLRVRDKKGREDWAAQGVVVVEQVDGCRPPAGPIMQLGWRFRHLSGHLDGAARPDHRGAGLHRRGAPNLNANAQGFTHYAAAWDGFIDIPVDGGYTFHLMDRDGARVVIDGVEVAKTGPPFAQVCGSPGNAMRYDRGALGLRAGKHKLHVEELHEASDGPPRLLWEGPSIPITEVPDAAFSHLRQDSVIPAPPGRK